jgi:hypothetical protein
MEFVEEKFNDIDGPWVDRAVSLYLSRYSGKSNDKLERARLKNCILECMPHESQIQAFYNKPDFRQQIIDLENELKEEKHRNIILREFLEGKK